MSMVGFPLLLIPLAIYNIIVFLMPGVSFTDSLVKLTLMSGTAWSVTLSDMLLALGMLLLLLEVIKGARPGAKYLTDHLLSFVVFGAAAAEFVLWPRFGNSSYFLLTLLALVDFLSGTALHMRRRVPVTQGEGQSRQGKSGQGKSGQATSAPVTSAPVAAGRDEAEPARATVRQPPQFEPAPAPAVPAAAAVAEEVLLDHPAPSLTHPEAAAHAPSPEVASPELQPGEDAPRRDTPPG